MKIPELPKGPVIPNPTFLSDTENLIHEHEINIEHSHDYKVAFLGIIGGGIMGLITSIIFWLITK